MRFLVLILFFISLLTSSTDGISQAINTPFGKNRIQYHNDQYNWSRYETENFVTYWYGKSRNIAQPIIQLAELDHGDIQKLLEHALSDKIEIIVYTDLSDLKQSNIGLEEAFTNQEGETKVQGNKMMVYFDGNHQTLREDIKKGMANVYLNSILYGSNLQEIVQNALLLNLPPWYSNGLTNFAASEWNYEIDDELRDLLLTKKKYKDFEKFAFEHPRAAGHSFWYYISETFGSSTIANIVYLTRISRSLKNSFLFILGVELEVIKNDWYAYFMNKYAVEHGKPTPSDSLDQIKLKNKKGVPVSHFEFNHDGSLLAYVTNERSKVKVWVKDMKTGKEKRIFKYGHKNIFQEEDYNYPLITWHPQYPELSILYESRDVLKLRKHDLKANTSTEDDFTTNFQRVYSIDQVDLYDYVLSATSDGYSDLYTYNSDRRHHKRITEDFYDDLEAQVINYNGNPSILFRSNRKQPVIFPEKIDTILPIDNFDIYLLKGLDADAELVRLTATENINEHEIRYLGNKKISFQSAHSGINNIYALDLESGKTTAITNLERNIIKSNIQPGTNKAIINYYYKGNYDNFLIALHEESSSSPYKTELYKKTAIDQGITIPYLPEDNDQKNSFSEGMKFQSKFGDIEDLQPLEETELKDQNSSLFDKYFKDYFSNSVVDGKRIIKFNPMRSTASRERFRIDNFVTKMDNSVLFEGLESYTGDDKELNNVPLGLLIKGKVVDLFEDYKIELGVRLPTRFNGYEFFLTIDDDKKLWDKRYALYRRSETEIFNANVNPVSRNKRHTILGMYRLKYPFNVYQSVRFTSSLRFDKFFLLATDVPTFNAAFTHEKRLSLKAEYVYDNSLDANINIKNGTRMKFYIEGINEFDLKISNGFEFDLSKALTGVVGFDARHYIPVLKRMVLALRASGATSFGNKRIVYYLGGMENWIFSSSEEDIPVPQDGSGAFKVLAPHMRGFANNIRNGNTYGLVNAEFRVPIFQYLGFSESKFAFIRNMQITGFFDTGVAWYGANPNDERNTLNSIIVSSPTNNPVIEIEARFFRNPIIYGYGGGLRTTVLGYYVKFDYAWGVENGNVRAPRGYLSLGYDF